jgi:hypothetical protein
MTSIAQAARTPRHPSVLAEAELRSADLQLRVADLTRQIHSQVCVDPSGRPSL